MLHFDANNAATITPAIRALHDGQTIRVTGSKNLGDLLWAFDTSEEGFDPHLTYRGFDAVGGDPVWWVRIPAKLTNDLQES